MFKKSGMVICEMYVIIRLLPNDFIVLIRLEIIAYFNYNQQIITAAESGL